MLSSAAHNAFTASLTSLLCMSPVFSTVALADSRTEVGANGAVVIVDNETPMAALASGTWSSVNLLITTLVIMLSIMLILMLLTEGSSKNQYREYRNDLHSLELRKSENRHTLVICRLLRVLSIVPAIVAALAFAITQDTGGLYVVLDEWTPLMLVVLAVQIGLVYLVHNQSLKLNNI